MSRHIVVTNAAVVTRYQSALASEDYRLATLVALDAPNLPSSDNFIECAALVEEFLPLSERQFIDIAKHKGVRDILDAEALLLLEIERVLSSTGEASKYGQGAVRIRKGLGKSVRSQKVEAIVKAAFDLGQKSVVGRLPEILKAAIGIDSLILGERPKGLSDASWPIKRSKSRKGWFDSQRCGGTAIYVLAEGVAEREEFRIEIVDLRDGRTQARCVSADVTDAKDQIRGKLTLDLEAPILDHAWPSVVRGNIGDTSKAASPLAI